MSLPALYLVREVFLCYHLRVLNIFLFKLKKKNGPVLGMSKGLGHSCTPESGKLEGDLLEKSFSTKELGIRCDLRW